MDLQQIKNTYPNIWEQVIIGIENEGKNVEEYLKKVSNVGGCFIWAAHPNYPHDFWSNVEHFYPDELKERWGKVYPELFETLDNKLVTKNGLWQ